MKYQPHIPSSAPHTLPLSVAHMFFRTGFTGRPVIFTGRPVIATGRPVKFGHFAKFQIAVSPELEGVERTDFFA